MPIYEFQCLECQAGFEAIVSSAEAVKKVVCKTCKSGNIQKIISAGSYRLSQSSSQSQGAAAACAGKSGFR